MTLTQSILDCKTPKEVMALVDSQAKAALRGWKKKLLEEALEGLVAKHNGGAMFNLQVKQHLRRPAEAKNDSVIVHPFSLQIVCFPEPET